MKLHPGARAFARALFFSLVAHGTLFALLPGVPGSSIGMPSPFLPLEATLAPAAKPVHEEPPGVKAVERAPEPQGTASVPEAARPSRGPARQGPNVEPDFGGAPKHAPLAAGDIVPDDLLTVRPQVLNMIRLDTPELRRVPASGRLVLELTVRKNGRVSNVLVVHNELPGPYLAHAMNAFTHATYSPGQLGDVAVDSRLRVEIEVAEGGAAVVGGPAAGERPASR